MNVLMVCDLTMSNGLNTAKSSDFEYIPGCFLMSADYRIASGL